MPGERWLTEVRAAEEVTYGVRVTPATRKLYLTNPVFTDDGENTPATFETGTPDNVRGANTSSRMPTGSASLPLSSDELVEYLLMTLNGTVTPTTPAGGTLARDWVFSPSTTSDSASIEWNDGARVWAATGTRVNTMSFTGEVGGDQMVNLGFFASDLTIQSLTGSVTDRVPSFMRGWELRTYFGALGTDPATLNSTPYAVKSYTVNINNNLQRKFLGNNTQAMTAAIRGNLGVDGTVMFEASNAQAATEVANYRAGTTRMMRLELGNNSQIESSPTTEVQLLTISGTPTGGTFTVTFRGSTSATVAYNATAAVLQVALENMPSIGAGNVVVSGGPGPGTPFTLTFAGQLAGENIPQVTAAHTFTGGAGPNIAPSTTTPGVGYKRLIWIDVPMFWTKFDLSGEDAGTRMYSGSFSYTYDSTNAYSLRVTCRNSRATAWA